MNEHHLSDPAFFNFINEAGAPCRGADQEWYRESWQRKAGCGPTTAATVLSYLGAHHPQLGPLASDQAHTAREFVDYMETVWLDVTPTNMGLNSLKLFSHGSRAFAKKRGVSLSYQELNISGVGYKNRPSWEDCHYFITAFLDHDFPVAFLNFSNGKLQNLESWHWVPIIAARDTQDGTLLCTILDEGEERTIDFRLWYDTTRFGGGLVVLMP